MKRDDAVWIIMGIVIVLFWIAYFERAYRHDHPSIPIHEAQP